MQPLTFADRLLFAPTRADLTLPLQISAPVIASQKEIRCGPIS